MIRRPLQLANIGLQAPREPYVLPEIAGLDFERAAENIVRAGGNRTLFVDLFSAACAAGGAVRQDEGVLLGLVSLAGWRSGALGLRTDALGRLSELLTDRRTREAAATVLALPTDVIDEFARRQASDRFWWPGRAGNNGYVCSFGGFSGLGGPWVAPIDAWHRLAAGGFGVRAADEWWRLDADAFGSRLVHLGAEAPVGSEPAEPEPIKGVDAAASRSTVVVRTDTYLAWLHVQEAA